MGTIGSNGNCRVRRPSATNPRRHTRPPSAVASCSGATLAVRSVNCRLMARGRRRCSPASLLRVQLRMHATPRLRRRAAWSRPTGCSGDRLEVRLGLAEFVSAVYLITISRPSAARARVTGSRRSGSLIDFPSLSSLPSPPASLWGMSWRCRQTRLLLPSLAVSWIRELGALGQAVLDRSLSY
jgi:hypothetical protein